MKLDSLVGALAGVVLLLGAAPVARAQPLDVSWAELTPGATLAAESFWGFTASFDGERIATIKRAYRALYMGDAKLDEAKAELAEIASGSDDVRAFLDFIEAGERPLLR